MKNFNGTVGNRTHDLSENSLFVQLLTLKTLN